MSLINDALKRASQADKERSQARPNDVPMQPVAARQTQKTGLSGSVVIIAIALLIGCAGIFFWQATKNRSDKPTLAVAANQTSQAIDNKPVESKATTPAVQSPPVTPSPAPVEVKAVIKTPAAEMASAPPPAQVIRQPVATPAIAEKPPTTLQPTASKLVVDVKKTETLPSIPVPAPRPAQPIIVAKPAEKPIEKLPTSASLPPKSTPATEVAATVKATPTVVVAPAAPPADLAAPAKNIVPSQPAVTTPPVAPPPTAPAPAPAAPAVVVTTPPVAVNVQFPNLALQGIFYRPAKPSALINGRTVFIGDHVGEVLVTAIDRRSVKVELEGATKTIYLK